MDGWIDIWMHGWMDRIEKQERERERETHTHTDTEKRRQREKETERETHTERERERQRDRETERQRDREPQPPFSPSVASLCHPRITTTHLSYRFPILETSATALCGTTGTCTSMQAAQEKTGKHASHWCLFPEDVQLSPEWIRLMATRSAALMPGDLRVNLSQMLKRLYVAVRDQWTTGKWKAKGATYSHKQCILNYASMIYILYIYIVYLSIHLFIDIKTKKQIKIDR